MHTKLAAPRRHWFQFSLRTLFLSVTIIAVGPLVSVARLMNGEPGRMFPSIGNVLILSAVTAAVSAAIHFGLKHPIRTSVVIRGTFWSVVASYILCALLLWIWVKHMEEARARAQAQMWFPVLIMFMVTLGLPTVLSVSYGVGRIVREFTASSSKTPPGPQ